MNYMPSQLTGAIVLCIALTTTQIVSGAHQPQQPSPPRPADLLRGPAVPPESTDTLGTIDINARFTPVEGRPELAAFAMVTDDPNDLARARELGSERVFDLAFFLVDEIDTVKAITDAIGAGEDARAQLLLASLRLKFEPDLPRDPIRPKLEALLDEAQIARMNRILDDYWEKWVRANAQDDMMNDAGVMRNHTQHQRIENLLSTRLFQQDIRTAYEYSLQRYQQSMQAIYDAIDPTDEQRAWIRARYIEHIKDTRLQATDEQRLGVMLEIYHMLDETRKEMLFSFIAGVAIKRAR